MTFLLMIEWQYDHGKIFLHQGLADIQDVDTVVCQNPSHVCDDALLIFCKYGNDCFQMISPFVISIIEHYKTHRFKSKPIDNNFSLH